MVLCMLNALMLRTFFLERMYRVEEKFNGGLVIKGGVFWLGNYCYTGAIHSPASRVFSA